MAEYYDCDTSLVNVGTALIDYYGAYDAGANPTGGTVYASSATSLMFSCTAISDKVIKLLVTASIPLAYYGDAYSGGDITNSVTFGGSSTTGTLSKIHLVLANNTFLMNTLMSTQISKIYLIGKLTNDAYLAAGMVGINNSSYAINHFSYLTATQTAVKLGGLVDDYKTTTGKIYKTPLIVYDIVAGLTLVSGEPLALRDVSSCSRRLGADVLFRGADYFITTSDQYTNGPIQITRCSILVEDVV